MEKLEGTVEQIMYQAKDSGYAIAQFQVPGQRHLIKIVGYFAQIQTGQALELEGNWQQHPKYGEQFQVSRYRERLPDSLDAIENYLASGLFKGIGKAIAKRIVERFGDRTIAVLDHEIERLTEVTGLTKKKIQQIQAAWYEQHAARQALMFLQGHGLSTSEAIRVWKKYDTRTVELVQQNPYCLTEVDRIGFVIADRVAQSLGFTPDSAFRYQSAIFYALTQSSQNGHCCLPLSQLIEQTAKLLPQPQHRPNLASIRQIVLQLTQEKQLVMQGGMGSLQGKELVYLPAFYQAEVRLAELLRSLSQRSVTTKPTQIQAEMASFCREAAIALSREQQQAIDLACQSSVAILVGAPGTGKTFTLRVLVALWRSMGKNIALASPTGRAAQRLGEVTGYPAKTIHRLLEFNPFTYDFERNEERPLDVDVIVIDETSMLDLFLAYSLLKAIPTTAQVLLVGDPDQLPSVGAGRVLQDLIDSGKIPIARLTQIFRQAQASAIVTNAHRINSGQAPVLHPLPLAVSAPTQLPSDCLWVEAETADQAIAALETLILGWLPQLQYRPEEVQVLMPMRKGDAGTTRFNQLLQQLLNPANPRKPEWQRGETILRVGDRMIQQVNNYSEEVFNGDLGMVTAIDTTGRKVTVSFPEKNVTYAAEMLDEITHGFSLTVHKSQGSEYPVVIFLLLQSHYPMLRRNLLYTGLTRARRLAILMGSREAIAIAVRQQREQQRYTQLQERLMAD